MIMHVGFHAPIALVTGTMTPVLSFGTSDMETFSMRALIAGCFRWLNEPVNLFEGDFIVRV